MKKANIAVGCALCIVIAAAGWSVLRPVERPAPMSPGVSSQPIDPEALRAIRSSVPFTETGATWGAAAASVRPVFEAAAARDEASASVVSPEARRLLVEELSAQVAARSAGDADAFVALALQHKPRWVSERDPRAWKVAADFAGQGYESTVDATKPEATLRALAEAMVRGNMRLTAIGGDAGGCLVKFGRVRTRDGLANELWLGDVMDAYWNSGPTIASIRIWNPSPSLDEVLRRDKSAAVAWVGFIVRTEKDRTTKIISTWYFDPRGGRWHCDSMVNRGRALYAAVY